MGDKATVTLNNESVVLGDKVMSELGLKDGDAITPETMERIHANTTADIHRMLSEAPAPCRP